MLSGDSGSVAETNYPGTPVRIDSTKKSTTASLKYDSDNVSVWSDNIKLTVLNPQVGVSSTDEKKSLLERRFSCDRRASQNSSVVNHPLSPRPGSQRSRRSFREESIRSQHSSRSRHDSGKSHTENRSISFREGEKNKGSVKKKTRKASDSTSTSSSSAASGSDKAGENRKGYPGKRKHGFMTAQEAVKLGDSICGCLLKSKVIYFLKPLVFLLFGSLLISGGLALTVLHFIYEDSLTQDNPPYFTYGPITVSTGVIIFMVGLVWFPIKQQKWKDGTASPMIAALTKWRMEKSDVELGGITAFQSMANETESDGGSDENTEDTK